MTLTLNTNDRGTQTWTEVDITKGYKLLNYSFVSQIIQTSQPWIWKKD